MQERLQRISVAGFPHVPVPSAITRSFGEDNNSMIDRRAWLEVEDPKHRYAKNLRMYYKVSASAVDSPGFWLARCGVIHCEEVQVDRVAGWRC